ncbi:MAG: type II secretion system minor pseudopilin GspK [Gammaproteobacteria bacterium]
MVNNRRQTGIALLSVLLVVVLATIAAVAMTSRQQVDIRRTENILRNDQVYLYLLGAEDWARHILARDAKDSSTDTLDEDWATILPPMPVEGGQISGKIEDLQSRFNLNSLLLDGQLDEVNYKRFKRLLALLEIPVSIADATVDWLDGDQEPRPQGAEDIVYLGMEFPHRVANGEMASNSELLYMPNMDYDSFEKLKPFVCALPSNTPININTAPAPVLASIAEDISLQSAEQLVEERGGRGYASVDEFLKHKVFAGKKPGKSGLSVNSQHFLLSAKIELGQSQSSLQSMVKRVNNNNLIVLQRIQGEI